MNYGCLAMSELREKKEPKEEEVKKVKSGSDLEKPTKERIAYEEKLKNNPTVQE